MEKLGIAYLDKQADIKSVYFLCHDDYVKDQSSEPFELYRYVAGFMPDKDVLPVHESE